MCLIIKGDITFDKPYILDDINMNAVILGDLRSDYEITFRVNKLVIIGNIFAKQITLDTQAERYFIGCFKSKIPIKFSAQITYLLLNDTIVKQLVEKSPEIGIDESLIIDALCVFKLKSMNCTMTKHEEITEKSEAIELKKAIYLQKIVNEMRYLEFIYPLISTSKDRTIIDVQKKDLDKLKKSLEIEERPLFLSINLKVINVHHTLVNMLCRVLFEDLEGETCCISQSDTFNLKKVTEEKRDLMSLNISEKDIKKLKKDIDHLLLEIKDFISILKQLPQGTGISILESVDLFNDFKKMSISVLTLLFYLTHVELYSYSKNEMEEEFEKLKNTFFLIKTSFFNSLENQDLVIKISKESFIQSEISWHQDTKRNATLLKISELQKHLKYVLSQLIHPLEKDVLKIKQDLEKLNFQIELAQNGDMEVISILLKEIQDQSSDMISNAYHILTFNEGEKDLENSDIET